MTTETHWRHLLDLLAPRGATPAPVPDDAWEGLLALADRLEVQPLLYSRVRNQEGLTVPPSALEALRHAYLRTTFANTQLYHHLGVLLSEARAAGIPVIVLKGACLAEVVYGDIGLRPMCDVDLMTRLDALRRGLEVTERLGHASNAQPPDMARQRALMVEWLPVPLRPARGHPSLAGAELEALWARAWPVTIASVDVQMLGPDDQVLHLAAHLSLKHEFWPHGLRGCHDLALVLDKYRAHLDWDTIRQRATSWRMWHGVALALRLAHDWAGADLPAAALASVRAATADEGILEWVEQTMHEQLPDVSLHSGLPEVIARPGVLAKIGGLARSLFPSPGHMASLYGARARSWLLPLYYLRRIGDVTRRHAGTVWRLLSRDAQTRDLFRREAALRTWLDQG